MKDSKRKIGIMGGTFNPIHYGHLIIAEDARNYCRLDEVLFMPSGNSYMKDADEILEGGVRFEMVKLAILSNPYFSSSHMEIRRKGNTYTYETLEELQKIYPDAALHFILGADNLFSLEKWKCFESVLHSCTLIVASRGEVSYEQLEKQKKHLEESYQASVILLPERKMDISSTEIRERVLKGQSVRYMTPEGVCKFIEERHLYEK